jgi:hypothetical protein
VVCGHCRPQKVPSIAAAVILARSTTLSMMLPVALTSSTRLTLLSSLFFRDGNSGATVQLEISLSASKDPKRLSERHNSCASWIWFAFAVKANFRRKLYT